jgi:hypothetical protein
VRNTLAVAISFAVLFSVPNKAEAQRFGGQFGGGAAFWLVYVDPGIDTEQSFGRDIGNVAALGARAFFQTGRVRLGAGFFGGGFTDEGTNESGNKVEGSLSSGGFIAEYLALQKNFEIALGGMAGGGVITVEEHISSTGDIESLLRRRTSYFAAYPWARFGYNPAPLVNVGLEFGYYLGTNDVGGFAASLDIVVGLIP